MLRYDGPSVSLSLLLHSRLLLSLRSSLALMGSFSAPAEEGLVLSW